MTTDLTLGLLGLDTSHCEAFVKLLNLSGEVHHVNGGKVVYACPAGSPEFELSYSRLEGITRTIQQEYGIELVETPEQLAEKCDAILMTSVYGGDHLEQFRKIASYGKPVFVDKPFAFTTADAREIFAMAAQHGVPVMSASMLRYAEELTEAVAGTKAEELIGIDCYGPMHFPQGCNGYFWYGIHTVEMLYRALGKGCAYVHAVSTEGNDVITGVWKDGRIGSVRGHQKGAYQFGAMVHTTKKSIHVNAAQGKKPMDYYLLEDVIEMFKSGKPSIDPEETIEIIRFLEAANESKATGRKVVL